MDQQKQILARFTGVYRRGFLLERYEVILNLFTDHVEGEGFIFKNNEISGNMVRYKVMLKDIVAAGCRVLNGISVLEIIFEHRMNGKFLRETLVLPGLLSADKAASDILHAQGVYVEQREPSEEKQDEFLEALINNTAFKQGEASPFEPDGGQAEVNLESEYEKSPEIKLEPIVLNLGTEEKVRENEVKETTAVLESFRLKVEKLKLMRENQLLTEWEFEEEKKRLLSEI